MSFSDTSRAQYSHAAIACKNWWRYEGCPGSLIWTFLTRLFSHLLERIVKGMSKTKGWILLKYVQSTLGIPYSLAASFLHSRVCCLHMVGSEFWGQTTRTVQAADGLCHQNRGGIWTFGHFIKEIMMMIYEQLEFWWSKFWYILQSSALAVFFVCLFFFEAKKTRL